VKRLVLIRHGDDPADDRVATFATANGFRSDLRRVHSVDRVPRLDEFDDLDDLAGVVLYGGPYAVYETDQHPFLKDENSLIEQCIEQSVPLLGICQGAQSIAHVLGARVGPPESGVAEFGYYEVTPTDEGRAEGFLSEPMHMLQNHFHGFDVPTGAVRLCGSDAFPNQAFRYGQCTYGVQFHPEVTTGGLRRWQDAPWARWTMPGTQSREQQDTLAAEHDQPMGAWLDALLGRLFASA
jgi:GMP synthase (glutamine-hydrolysing)